MLVSVSPAELLPVVNPWAWSYVKMDEVLFSAWPMLLTSTWRGLGDDQGANNVDGVGLRGRCVGRGHLHLDDVAVVAES